MVCMNVCMHVCMHFVLTLTSKNTIPYSSSSLTVFRNPSLASTCDVPLLKPKKLIIIINKLEAESNKIVNRR